jgi:hypothetical protein
MFTQTLLCCTGKIVSRDTRAEVVNYRIPGIDREENETATASQPPKKSARPSAIRQPPYCSRVLSSATGLAWGRTCNCTATAPNERAVAAASGLADSYARMNPRKKIPSQGASLDGTHFNSATHRSNMTMFQVPLRLAPLEESPHPTLAHNERLWPNSRLIEFGIFANHTIAHATTTGHCPPSFQNMKMFFLREWRAADERAALESDPSYLGVNRWIPLHDAQRELRALDGY